MLEYDMPQRSLLLHGPVPDEDLAAYYRHADVYISLSEHEGFCVPLLEAMAADVPVLAYGAAAVPETMGGAGVVFNPKDLELAAEWLGVLAYDGAVRRRVIDGPARPARRVRRRTDVARARRPHRGVRLMLQPTPMLSASRGVPREDRLHRPALRHRHPRRLGVPLPADRRASSRRGIRSKC